MNQRESIQVLRDLVGWNGQDPRTNGALQWITVALSLGEAEANRTMCGMSGKRRTGAEAIARRLALYRERRAEEETARRRELRLAGKPVC